jgi:hypothetical protein
MSSRPTGEAVQEGNCVAGELGSMELRGVWRPTVTADLAAFLPTADATVAALERRRRGVYDVVDDEPARVADWMPALVRPIGAKPPRRVPRWLGLLLVGEAFTIMMTEVRGGDGGW